MSTLYREQAPILRVSAKRAFESGKISKRQYDDIIRKIEMSERERKERFDDDTLTKMNKILIGRT